MDTAAVLLLDPSVPVVGGHGGEGDEEEVRQGVRIPVGEGFAGRIAARAQPVVLDHVDRGTVVNPILIDKKLQAMAGVPMLAGERVIGVLHVGSITPRAFADEDLELLKLVADRASLATQARLAQLDRDATLALQRSLIPARPPTITGLDAAARYIPGAEVGVGGDWYDLFQLPTGHVGIAIGDVAGSGLRAAVVMGRIRSALRAYGLDTEDPAHLLAKLDRNVHHFGTDTLATVVCAVVEPSLEMMSISVAGHPPPIMAAPGNEPAVLDLRTDLAIGVVPDQVRHANRVAFEPGSVLFLYTDGLVERRDLPLDARIEILRRSVSTDPAESVCASVMDQLVGSHHVPDDIALLTLRRLPR